MFFLTCLLELTVYVQPQAMNVFWEVDTTEMVRI